MSPALLLCGALALGAGGPAASSPWAVERVVAQPGPLEPQLPRLQALARKEGKHLLLYFHARWCGPCRAVEKAFHRPQNQRTFARWLLVEADVDGLPDGPVLGQDFEVIPYFLRLDDQGRVQGTLGGDQIGDPFDPARVDAAFRQLLRP